MKIEFNKENFEKLNDRIETLFVDGLIEQRSQAIVYLMLTHRFYCEPLEIREAFTDGGNDLGVDAIYIDRRGDDPTVHIFQSKVHESTRKASNPFACTAIEKAVRFFTVLKDTRSDLKKLVNPNLEQKILEIREAVRTDWPSFKLWLVSNGACCVGHELASHTAALHKVDEVEVEEFHLNEVVEFCLNAHSTRVNHQFYAREVGVIEAGNSELRSAVGYISAQELYNLLKDLRDERRVDYAVFNLNVRGFLGLDNPVNKEIVRTAASPRNVHFASLNNGITIVGSTLRVNTTGTDRAKVGIKRMSIVNGAQTCHSIFEAMKDYYPNFEIFRNLSVLFRVFETDDPKLISDIAISTNNQNRISPRDLRANDEFQVRLEAELKEYGLTYRRKRQFAAYDDHPLSRQDNLDALKAGQIILSYVHLDPARAKRDSDAIFTDFYGKLFGRVDVPRLVEGYNWLKVIEERKKYIEDEVRIRGARRTENTFVTYGVFHILMMCGILNPKATEEDRSAVIDESIGLISEHLMEVGEPAYYKYFRDAGYARELTKRANQPRLI
ncbi:MAG: AIPR family protein [Rhodobacteraceae bacterium]|nr:AIPR family protein [Paracoccaceae bacterium]